MLVDLHFTAKDALGVDRNYDSYDIPYDVLWLDIEHTDGKKYFTWDSRYFPDSKTMLAKFDTKKRKVVTIVDPHIKSEVGSEYL